MSDQKNSHDGFYRQLFDIVNDAIFVHDIETGRILDVNQTMLDMYGYTYEEALTCTIGDLSSEKVPYSQSDAVELVRRASTEGPQLFEWRAKDKQGRLFWVEVNLKHAVIDGQERMVAIVRDIGERKKVEHELARSQTLFLAAIEQNPAGILLADAGMTCIHVANRAALEILGETVKSVMDYSLDSPPSSWQALHPNGRKYRIEELPLVRALLTGKGVENVEMIIQRKDGQRRWILTNASAIRDESGVIIAGIVVFADITELKAAERDRERLMKALKAKNEELESIIYVASHDLRSPLVNIMGFSREIQNACHQVCGVFSRAELSPEDRELLKPVFEHVVPEALQYIESGTLKMEMLLDGLLKLSRVVKAPMELTRIDMNQLMDNLINAMQFQIKERHVRVTVEELPSCRADVRQISQVFTNLLDNALKYQHKPQGGMIHITGRYEKQSSIYCVVDDGRGIPEHRLEQIFDLFHRLDPEGPVPGEGLGLTIVRRIMDRHHGDVWVESSSEGGSKFFVSLPNQ